VDLTTMGFADMGPALANGGIDAAMSIEPNMTDLVERGVGRIWVRNDEVIPNQQNAVLLYATGFAQDQADAARRFMVGYLKGVRRYNDAFSRNDAAARADVVDILSQRTSVKNAALYDRIVMPGLHPDGTVNVASLQAESAYFQQQGQQAGPVDIDGAVDATFAQYALQQLGPYR
jgi:NitT/TauT family transport system substrate-binding protein